MRTLLTFAISAVGSSAPFLLPKRERQKGGGGGATKKKSSLQCMLGILICSVAVQTLFSSGVKMLHHWHGLVEHVNAHFFFFSFF